MKHVPHYPQLCLALALLVLAPAGAASLTDAQRAASVGYVHGLQNEEGGFRTSEAAGPSQLGATSSSLRALKYLGGEVPNQRGLRLFILSCFDPETGGFADTPGAPPDVRSTAIGLMALAEVRNANSQRGTRAAEYLARHAKSLPDLYIAAAGLDAAGLKTPAAATWIAAWEATRNPDGTYGKGAGDTASAAISIMRLGGSLANREAAARALKAAQKPDGGFAGADGGSDLASTYRIMRALYMLKEKPDLARLREYLGRLRNADHGYGPAPGQPSTASTTYFTAIVLKWADELEK